MIESLCSNSHGLHMKFSSFFMQNELLICAEVDELLVFGAYQKNISGKEEKHRTVQLESFQFRVESERKKFLNYSC